MIYVPKGYKIQSESEAYRVKEQPSGVQMAHLRFVFEHETSSGS